MLRLFPQSGQGDHQTIRISEGKSQEKEWRRRLFCRIIRALSPLEILLPTGLRIMDPWEGLQVVSFSHIQIHKIVMIWPGEACKYLFSFVPPGRRKSAVELLQESKAFYVKSESVLDTRQELRNTDHLHVRSPTVDVSSMHYRSLPGNGGGGGGGGSLIPFFPIGTCPPYPHHHYERYEHVQFKFSDLDRQKRHISKERKDLLAEDTLIPDSGGRPVLSMWSSIPPSKSDRRNITGYSTTGSTHNKNRSTRSATRRSTLPSGNFDLQQQQQQQQQHKQTDGVNGFLSGSKLMGLTLPFPVVLGQPEKNSRTFLRSSGMERHGASTLPMSSTSKVSHERKFPGIFKTNISCVC